MDNAAIADNFKLLSQLMEIHGENSFKAKTYSIASYNVEQLDTPLRDMPREQIFTLRGMSGSVGQKVVEMLDTSHLEVLQAYILNTPAGVIEMLNIKGIGPKKIHTIWKEMEIESVGELLYACNENRLTRFKGFGAKTQQNVIDSIEFYMLNQGSFLYAQLMDVFPQVDGYLKKMFGADKTAVTGAWRRQDLTIDELEYVVLLENEKVKPVFETAQPPELLEETPHSLFYKLKNGLRLRLYTGVRGLGEALFTSTAAPDFLSAFTKKYPAVTLKAESEEAIFAAAGLPSIPPYYRNHAANIADVVENGVPEVIVEADIRGIIHSHSTWSDGGNSIEEMIQGCIDKGYEYLVISDHSRAAAYARGLSEERIVQQHAEVDQLNARYPQFRVFKSIECDILTDGSMDYGNDVLSSFDLVIASIHSNLKMPQERAMMRLMKAIENPYTTILGHMTGRLLLSRKGYPVDHERIIDACAANGVAIEINAHPRRLDIDWAWIPYARKKKVMLSINPDAHHVDGYADVKYGVLAAQKGGLRREDNLSSMNLEEFTKFLARQK